MSENEVPQAEALADVLRGEGYTVYASPTVGGSKAIAEVHAPDAVILDLLFVNGSGREFLHWLRGRERTAAVLVVVTTGLAPDEVTDLAGLSGVVIFHKPYDVADLLAELRRRGVVPLHAGQGGGR